MQFGVIEVCGKETLKILTHQKVKINLGNLEITTFRGY